MRQLKLAVIGLGRLGRFHAATIGYRLPHVSLSAVCSLVSEELKTAKQLYPETKTFVDFNQVLEESLDGIILSTPSHLHCQQIEDALHAGLHVFCEKPLGVDLEECERIGSIAKDFPEKVVMLGFMRRYDPSYQYAYEAIQKGWIGRPILYRGYSVDPLSQIEGALAYAPHSAGQFLDMAVHDIDLSRWLLGAEPKTVYAVGGCFAYEEFAKYQDGDHVAALLQFENAAMAFLYAGRTAPHGYNVETEIVGTKKTLRIGSVPQQNFVEILDHHGVRKLCSQDFIERFNQAYVAELQEFVDCIREDRKPDITLKDGIEATRIALACTTSFQNKTLINL